MINWGTVPAGSVLPFHFASYDGATGASEAISGLAVTDVEVYKNGSVTQRSSDAGYTLIDTDGIDIDSIVGANGFTIDTGDNTDSGFYSVGGFFTVWVASITADGQTVNFIAGTFRLSAAESSAGVPKTDTTHFGGSAGTFSGGRPEVNTTLIEGSDATNQIRDAVVDDATRIDASALNTASAAIGTDGTALTEAGGTGDHLTAINLPNQTMDITGNITGNLSGSVGSVSGAVGSVTADVGITQGGADKVWTSAARTLTSFGSLVADTATAVWGAATRLLTAGTNIVLAKGTGVTGFNDLSAAQVNAEADTALADYDGPTNAEMVARTLAAAAYATATAVDDLPTNSELTAALGTADDAVLAAIAALNDVSTADLAAALATYDGPTKAELDSAVALLATAANLALAKTAIDGIKTKTDPITYTETGLVDVNVQAINDVMLDGTGVLGDEMGPA
jgi:hypothetical protein